VSKGYNVGDKVQWSWGNGNATGKITERFTDDVERQIDKNKVKRNASNDEPAYMIEQEDGSRALKSHSEVKKA
jgi:hypothetical protein